MTGNWFSKFISDAKEKKTKAAGIGGNPSVASTTSTARPGSLLGRVAEGASPHPIVQKPLVRKTPKATELGTTFTKEPSPEGLTSIPVMHKGGKVKKTGLIYAKKDEEILTPEQSKALKKVKSTKASDILSKEEPNKILSLPITASPIAYFVRHPDTDMNDDDVFRGDYDPPINEHGKAQSKLLVHFFHNVKPLAIYHSSRLRTKQGIEPLAKSKGLKPILTKDLDSLNTGNFAGQPKDKENNKKMKWYREHPDAKIPGGQSVRDFQNHADDAFDRLFREGDNKEGKPVIASVHGSIIKELGRYLHGDIKAAHVEPGGVLGVYKLPNGAYIAKPLLDENDGDEELNLDS
jgi:alpha-ribazole phosphatase